MRNYLKHIALLSAPLVLGGCYTRTHITRTVHHADGSRETYENRSDGYNYNPNFTGHADYSNVQNVKFNGIPLPEPAQNPYGVQQPLAFGQYSVR